MMQRALFRLPLLLALVALAGCAAAGATNAPARVRVQALLAADPLWPQLASYDHAIAQLRATLPDPPLLARAGARIAADRRRLNTPSTPARIDTATSDRELTAQMQAQLRAFADAVGSRTRLAVNERAGQLHEAESRAELAYVQAHAAQRMRLELRLETLALTGTQRKHARSSLRRLQQNENRLLSAQRARDARTLAAFTQSEERSAAAEIADEARRMQTHAIALERARAGVHVDAAAIDPSAIRRTLRSEFARSAKAVGANDERTRARIAALRRERAAVKRAIVADVLRQAQQVAHRRGYSEIVTSGAPAHGLPDITASVLRALRYRYGT